MLTCWAPSITSTAWPPLPKIVLPRPTSLPFTVPAPIVVATVFAPPTVTALPTEPAMALPTIELPRVVTEATPLKSDTRIPSPLRASVLPRPTTAAPITFEELAATLTPVPALSVIVLRSTVLPPPPTIRTPSPPLPKGAWETSVPIRLPRTRMPDDWPRDDAVTVTPLPPLRMIVLPRPIPPITWLAEPATTTPSPRFDAIVLASMRLPTTRVAAAVSAIRTPVPL